MLIYIDKVLGFPTRKRQKRSILPPIILLSFEIIDYAAHFPLLNDEFVLIGNSKNDGAGTDH